MAAAGGGHGRSSLRAVPEVTVTGSDDSQDSASPPSNVAVAPGPGGGESGRRASIDSDGGKRRKKPLIGMLFPSWGHSSISSSAEDSRMQSREEFGATSSDFDPFQIEEREAIQNQERDKAKSDGLVERLRTLGRQLAQESDAHGTTKAVDGADTIANLQREIASLQEELQAYRSREWRSSSAGSMGPKVVGEFAHQQAQLTAQTYTEFEFKGVVTVHNRYKQVIDTFDVIPDAIVMLDRSESPSATSVLSRSDSPPAAPAAPEPKAPLSPTKDVHAATSLMAGLSLKRPRGFTLGKRSSGGKGSDGASVESADAATAAATAGGASGATGRRRSTADASARTQSGGTDPGSSTPGSPASESSGGGGSSSSSDQARLQQTILDVALSLQRRGTDPVTQPDAVVLHYYLRNHKETRHDCLFEFSVSAREVYNEMFVQIQEAGGLARLQPPGRRPSPQPLARSASASQHRRSNSDVTKASRALNDGSDARRSAVLAFELSNAMDGCEIRTGFDVVIGSNGEPYPVLNKLLITLPVLRTANNLIVRRVREPVLTSKNIQNFWFRLQVELPEDPTTGRRLVLGPFMPSEQHLALEATHYQLEQEFSLADVILLGPLKWIEKRSPYNITYRFTYHLRDRSQTASSMFQVASFEIAQSEIVKNSQGFQKLRDRFRIEKQAEMGMVHGTFHLYVREEVIPEPSTSGEPVNPVTGAWILERVSLAIRVSDR